MSGCIFVVIHHSAENPHKVLRVGLFDFALDPLSIRLFFKTHRALMIRIISMMPSLMLIWSNSCIKLCGCIKIHADILVVANALVPVEGVVESPFTCHILYNNAR